MDLGCYMWHKFRSSGYRDEKHPGFISPTPSFVGNVQSSPNSKNNLGFVVCQCTVLTIEIPDILSVSIYIRIYVITIGKKAFWLNHI